MRAIKTADIIMAAMAAAGIVTTFTGVTPQEAGVTTESTLQQRLVFHFFHAGIFHALANAWCVISVIRADIISVRDIITAYAIATLAPTIVLQQQPTVGLSAFCFALMGLISAKVQRKAFFHKCVLAFIAAGFIIPSVNAAIHLYAYAAACATAYITAAIRKRNT